MAAHTFFHDHYSPEVGESPIGHAAAMLVGLFMMAAGIGLACTVALLPIGVVFGLLGLLVFGGGMFGQIRRPLKLADLMETIVGLAGAAIGMTITLAIATFIGGFALTVFVLLLGWVRNAV